MSDCNGSQEGSCGCGNTINRRGFIKTAAWSAGLALVPPLGVFAGPFEENDYLKLITADKKLNPDWIKSLYSRGQKEVYTDARALNHIGMPVGGLFAGTVYLSGDGRLWLWDIFNQDQEGILPKTIEYQGRLLRTRDGANFVEPAEIKSPFATRFELVIGDQLWSLDQKGFSRVEFDGRYPMARIRFSDPNCPVEVLLEAFSPFIPTDTNDSALPATIMSYTLINNSGREVDCRIQAWVENPVCVYSAADLNGFRQNRVVEMKMLRGICCEAFPIEEKPGSKRKDILYEDFEKESYGEWKATGTAFGSGPVRLEDVPEYQGNLGGEGSYLVNSHASAPGNDVTAKDEKQGTLTSPLFRIERDYIHFYLGGGPHKEKTCVNLLLEGSVVKSLTGKGNNAMERSGFQVKEWTGRMAQLQIVDLESGGWGNIGVDHIVFSDTPPASRPITEMPDHGTFCLSVLRAQGSGAFADGHEPATPIAKTLKMEERLDGLVYRDLRLGPESQESTDFLFTWHFPNFYGRDFGGVKVGHSYGARFQSALEVAEYIGVHRDRLLETTRKWVDTWYDSTLPYWLLDRTMANTSTLATTTCYRHKNGRFWAWEGIGCCTGTCTHVWHYAQAPGRLFPELERDQRERVDFGMALKENGEIGYRALLESSMGPAFDGQCGRILGAYREHLMSVKSDFLKRNWTAVKKALLYLIDRDDNLDGILEGSQPNTLDADWYGQISFISSLYIAALRAGERMALEMEDLKFAGVCKSLAEKGAEKMNDLFNGEYFIQIEDPEHSDVIGVGTGCYIDQIFGQTWSHWLGLGPIFDREKQLTALRSLYRYNFVPDVGPFRKHFNAGRWYAMEGDGGLLMCTWPKGGKRDQWENQWQFMYFNECMSGFEWQAASHMIYEGIDQPDILQNGLAVSRAIHDRYKAQLRNPYNEVECSDHYARAMASYGVFQAVCGFHYHGPKGVLSFDPRLSPESFRAPFVTAEGWGTYSQHFQADAVEFEIQIHYGKLRLRELQLRIPEQLNTDQWKLQFDLKLKPLRIRQSSEGLTSLEFQELELEAGQVLSGRGIRK